MLTRFASMRNDLAVFAAARYSWMRQNRSLLYICEDVEYA
jgi:hypothetical protein